MGVVNVMLLLPQIGGRHGHPSCCRRRRSRRHSENSRLAAAVTTLAPRIGSSRIAGKTKTTRGRSRIAECLLNGLLRRPTDVASLHSYILLVVLILISSQSFHVRATPTESKTTIPSAANHNLLFNNNGLATSTGTAAGGSTNSNSRGGLGGEGLGGSSDINLQNLNSINRNNKESSYSANNNNNENKNTRNGADRQIALLDPSTSLQNSAPGTRNASPLVTYSSSSSAAGPFDRIDASPTSHVVPGNSAQEPQQQQQRLVSKSRNDEYGITNITSQLQTHTYLPCKLSSSLLKQKQIGNKSVSWVRVRDDHILTVDRMTFITDDRFQSYYSESNGVWTLQIKYVQARDAGIYECQVSTEPKVSAQVQLNVVVPKTELVGEQIRYVKDGSNAILRCVVRGALEPPIYISWFYGAKQIYNDSPRGWKIMLERDILDNEPDGRGSSTIGSLIITSVRKRDSGNYTCSPSNSDEVTVMLHVINGEYSASAITSSSSRGRFSDLIVTIVISVVMLKTT